MNFFDKKKDNLIKDAISTAKDEISASLAPFFAVAIIFGLVGMATPKKETQQITINIYTNKEGI